MAIDGGCRRRTQWLSPDSTDSKQQKRKRDRGSLSSVGGAELTAAHQDRASDIIKPLKKERWPRGDSWLVQAKVGKNTKGLKNEPL